jgi:putative dehydrogenase
VSGERVAAGIVGAGAMGLAMALRLRDLGHEVIVRDIDPAREALAAMGGCAIAATPAELAARCALVVVAVVDAVQTGDVLFGAGGTAEVMGPGRCVMLCPTIGPADTERFAARLAAAGVDVVDAPMSGGPKRARDGTMSLMVACPDELFARWQPWLEALSDRIFRVGPRAGDGARTKLVNNLLAAVNLAGAAEAMALAGRLGLDARTTLAVIEQSSGQSWIGSDRLRRVLAGVDSVLAQAALLAKDSSLALAAAREAGFTAPVGEAAAARFAAALAAGHGAGDDSVLWALAAGRTDPAAAR